MERAQGDHGVFSDAVDYAVDVIGETEGINFLRAWREGDLDGWPEFYVWLEWREADAKAWNAEQKQRLKGFRI